MGMKAKPSPAYQLLSLVWESTPRGSWQRLNGAMRDAMDLAIEAGFTFASDDFKHAMENFRGGYWFDTEGFYARACRSNNLTAAQSFEAWQKRPPFIADDVDNRKRRRLAVGSRFRWRGALVTVTSFADDGSYLTACEYGGQHNRKVKNRHTITVAHIRAERQERLERKRLYTRLARRMAGEGLTPALKRRLKRDKIATQVDWDAAPVATLRAVVDKWEAQEDE